MKWPFKTLRKSFPICPTSRAAMSIFQVCVSQSTFLGVTAWIPLALLHTFHTKWCSGNTDTMLHLLANPLSSLWGQEKGTTEDEMAGWHDWLDERESEWTPGVGDGQGGLACCDSWVCKESDMTERLNWTELNWIWFSLLLLFEGNHFWDQDSSKYVLLQLFQFLNIYQALTLSHSLCSCYKNYEDEWMVLRLK